MDLFTAISDQAMRVSTYVVEVSFKEVIQPQVPLGLPCYDFTPVVNNSLGACLPAPFLGTNILSKILMIHTQKRCWVSSATSALVGSHGVTGGVYKARERIHRGVLIRDY